MCPFLTDRCPKNKKLLFLFFKCIKQLFMCVNIIELPDIKNADLNPKYTPTTPVPHPHHTPEHDMVVP